MGRTITIDTKMLSEMTDDEIRAWLSKNSDRNNFGYTFMVCRKCGVFTVDQDCKAENAKIVDVCRRCIEIPL